MAASMRQGYNQFVRTDRNTAAAAITAAAVPYFCLILLAVFAIGAHASPSRTTAKPPRRARAPKTPAPAVVGRFGGTRVNVGLSTLDVSPDGFLSPDRVSGAPRWRVQFGDGAAPISVRQRRFDATAMRLDLDGGGDGAPTGLLASLLYPGFSATFGPRLILRFSDKNGQPATPSVSVVHFNPTALLIWPNGTAPDVPLVVVIEGTSAVRSARDGATIRIDADRPLGNVRFLTPTGLGVAADDAAARAAAEDWYGRRVPKRLASTNTLSRDGARVTVTEIFDTDYAPVAPVVGLAADSGYPIGLPTPLVRSAVETRWGPFVYIDGHVARYDLPVPSAPERGLVVDVDAKLYPPPLENYAPTSAPPPLDTLNPESFQNDRSLIGTQLAGTFLLGPIRDKLTDAWQTRLTRLFGAGNDASGLYALSVYARWSGDWGKARSLWPSAERAAAGMARTEDWAWMAPLDPRVADDSATASGLWLGDAYTAAMGGLKMARLFGDTAAAQRYAIRAARWGVATSARLGWTLKLRESGALTADGWAAGFTEGGSGVSAAIDGLTALTTDAGSVPELSSLYRFSAREPLAALLPAGEPPADLSLALAQSYIRATVLDIPIETALPEGQIGDAVRLSVNVAAEPIGRLSPLTIESWGRSGLFVATWLAEINEARVGVKLAAPGVWQIVVRRRRGWRAVSASASDGKPVKLTGSGELTILSGRSAAGMTLVKLRLERLPE